MSEKEQNQHNPSEEPQKAGEEQKQQNEQQGENQTEEQASTDQSDAPVEEKLNALQEENDELRDKYLRLAAEFNNYKRRMVKEKMDMMNNAAQDTMSALLPVLDDFDRARKAADQNDKGDLFAEGIGLVYKKLYNTLKQKGLEPMDSEGQPFDPELHEALTEIPAPAEDLKGKVVDIIERGYTLNGKIIRHAKVVVGK
jgi:molecular chaperone GrpE